MRNSNLLLSKTGEGNLCVRLREIQYKASKGEGTPTSALGSWASIRALSMLWAGLA